MKKYRIGLFCLIIGHFFLFFFLGLFRHWGYLTSINDLANFDQAIWGTINGFFLLNTDVFDIAISRLAIHFDPIQLFFIPFYLIKPTVIWLIAGQPLALSLSAWPIFTLANHVYKSEKIGIIWALIFLSNPFLINAAAWDFHPITLAVPFVALTFWSIESKNFKLCIFCTLLILLCKEHLGIMVVGFGILWTVQTLHWRQGAFLVFIGAAHFYLVLHLIMPAFSPTGHHVMVSEGLGQLSRYSWLGTSFGSIAKRVFFQPFQILKIVFFPMGGLAYFFILLLPFLFFPILSPAFIFPGMADLATNMLSSNPMPRSPIAYHSVTLVPIMTVASIYGIKKLTKYQKKFSISELCYFVLVASVLLGYFLAPIPLPGSKNIWKPTSLVAFPDPNLNKIHNIVGNSSSVSVQANIGSHFSQRKEIYRFPNKLNEVDFVILHLQSPTKNIHSYDKEQINKRQFIIGILDNHLQMDRTEFIDCVENLLLEGNFHIAYWNKPWLILKRDVEGLNATNDALKHLNFLKSTWIQ